MAEISGEYGAVYFNEELTDTATIGSVVFSTGKTITSSSGSGSTGPFIDFGVEGYTSGMLVTVSGCTGESANDRIFTITGVSSGELTVSEAVTDSDPEPSAVVFTEADPGIQVGGFFSWGLSQTADALETTDFEGATGGRTYIAGLKGWTATAEKYFLTANNIIDSTGTPWWNSTIEIRLFTRYLATPSTGDQSQYFKGDTVVTGIDHTTPVDTLISQSVSFQGDTALALKTQYDPWSCGISA